MLFSASLGLPADFRFHLLASESQVVEPFLMSFASSSIPVNKLLAWSMGNGGKGYIRIKFPFNLAWYDEQPSTQFRSFQHRKEPSGFRHEFILLKMADGSICRVERTGDPNARAHALSLEGSVAHDLAQCFRPDDLAKAHLDTSSIVSEVHLPRELDLKDVLNICRAIQETGRTRNYTLQTFNCYFFSLALQCCLTRLVADWEDTIPYDTWRSGIQDAADSLLDINPREQPLLHAYSILCPNSWSDQQFLSYVQLFFQQEASKLAWENAVNEVCWYHELETKLNTLVAEELKLAWREAVALYMDPKERVVDFGSSGTSDDEFESHVSQFITALWAIVELAGTCEKHTRTRHGSRRVQSYVHRSRFTRSQVSANRMDYKGTAPVSEELEQVKALTAAQWLVVVWSHTKQVAIQIFGLLVTLSIVLWSPVADHYTYVDVKLAQIVSGLSIVDKTLDKTERRQLASFLEELEVLRKSHNTRWRKSPWDHVLHTIKGRRLGALGEESTSITVFLERQGISKITISAFQQHLLQRIEIQAKLVERVRLGTAANISSELQRRLSLVWATIRNDEFDTVTKARKSTRASKSNIPLPEPVFPPPPAPAASGVPIHPIPYSNGLASPWHYKPVPILPEGWIPDADDEGHIDLPPAHEIHPSPLLVNSDLGGLGRSAHLPVPSAPPHDEDEDDESLDIPIVGDPGFDPMAVRTPTHYGRPLSIIPDIPIVGDPGFDPMAVRTPAHYGRPLSIIPELSPEYQPPPIPDDPLPSASQFTRSRHSQAPYRQERDNRDRAEHQVKYTEKIAPPVIPSLPISDGHFTPYSAMSGLGSAGTEPRRRPYNYAPAIPVTPHGQPIPEPWHDPDNPRRHADADEAAISAYRRAIERARKLQSGKDDDEADDESVQRSIKAMFGDQSRRYTNSEEEEQEEEEQEEERETQYHGRYSMPSSVEHAQHQPHSPLGGALALILEEESTPGESVQDGSIPSTGHGTRTRNARSHSPFGEALAQIFEGESTWGESVQGGSTPSTDLGTRTRRTRTGGSRHTEETRPPVTESIRTRDSISPPVISTPSKTSQSSMQRTTITDLAPPSVSEKTPSSSQQPAPGFATRLGAGFSGLGFSRPNFLRSSSGQLRPNVVASKPPPQQPKGFPLTQPSSRFTDRNKNKTLAQVEAFQALRDEQDLERQRQWDVGHGYSGDNADKSRPSSPQGSVRSRKSRAVTVVSTSSEDDWTTGRSLRGRRL
ncbi:hypothetical protein FRC11_014948 [Ceratobasidium sp. 423]|nr:hypothetical protein FRC11_014948 [Ceratobasidium sp. 423]